MNATSLREQQEALLRALWSPRHEDAAESWSANAAGLANGWRRGLVAYRSNAHELAPRALAGAYPVVAQLLGEDNFKPLANALWRSTPPSRGDLAQWGGGLADLIESLPDLRDEEPYLADVARAEWLLHEAATAPDGALDAASFQLLAQHDPAALTLVLCPGAAVLSSAYPVVSVINAHVQQEPSLEKAGQRLRDAMAESALVWREGAKPQLRECAPGESVFVGALLNRQSLADALQVAPELDLNGWLVTAARSGLLLRAALL
jgi:hypothetical protein